eukprot:TRINITY_DN10276_c0_g1_i1.p1 TRINITY_DN10276_c0_g1~~TRINITY_DN10276_c0_g1_i1.p1  ORF type:complete len:321 (+),score=40.66 TRINITY_DN10276_c0_g1_i1:71-964(+)
MRLRLNVQYDAAVGGPLNDVLPDPRASRRANKVVIAPSPTAARGFRGQLPLIPEGQESRKRRRGSTLVFVGDTLCPHAPHPSQARPPGPSSNRGRHSAASQRRMVQRLCPSKEEQEAQMEYRWTLSSDAHTIHLQHLCEPPRLTHERLSEMARRLSPPPPVTPPPTAGPPLITASSDSVPPGAADAARRPISLARRAFIRRRGRPPAEARAELARLRAQMVRTGEASGLHPRAPLPLPAQRLGNPAWFPSMLTTGASSITASKSHEGGQKLLLLEAGDEASGKAAWSPATPPPADAD